MICLNMEFYIYCREDITFKRENKKCKVLPKDRWKKKILKVATTSKYRIINLCRNYSLKYKENGENKNAKSLNYSHFIGTSLKPKLTGTTPTLRNNETVIA